MLERTFCHLPGVTVNSELAMWRSGVECWDDVEADRGSMLEGSLRATIHESLPASRAAMRSGDLAYFARALPSSESWRLYRDFRDKAVYLDIETTGLGKETDRITTIVTYDGLNVEYFVQGVNLDRFPAYMRSVELLVTYNGKSFDLPFIAHEFRESFSPVHLDLMHILRSVGIRGGLKKCEQQLGLSRGDLDGADGYTAVLLWSEYCRTGNPRALETLLAYNALDVLNLEPLMITAFNRKIAGFPFGEELQIPMPQWQPSSPYEPDVDLVARLQHVRRYHRFR